MPAEKPILIIAGPTAVGKTDASLLLARELGAEIVSADSMQIYRGMDIGTAKPTKEQRALVYHHMIDVVDPAQLYSVGRLLPRRTDSHCGDPVLGQRPPCRGRYGTLHPGAHARTVPRPAGGHRAPGQAAPAGDPGREGTLYAELVRVDPEAAVKIHPNDLRRTIRALEVYYLRDRAISDFQREHGFNDQPYRFRLLFLTRERSELYPRIEQRVEQMIADGLEAEVRALREQGHRPDLPSMQGLGYKHFMDHFSGRTSRDEAIALLKRDTRRYAKRQFTWFRREPDTIPVDITGIAHPGKLPKE